MNDTVKVPTFTNKKPGRKPKSEIVAATKKRGRPTNEMTAKLQEIKGRLILGHGDWVLEQMIKAAKDPTDPAYAMALKFLGDRVLNVNSFQDEGNKQTAIRVTITDSDGQVTEVSTGKEEAEDMPVIIDMGDVTEVDPNE